MGLAERWRRWRAKRLEVWLEQLRRHPASNACGWYVLADDALVHLNTLGWLHHERLPAVSSASGRREWWHSGCRHREGGPAVEHPTGLTERWVWGEFRGFEAAEPLALDVAIGAWTSQRQRVQRWLEHDDRAAPQSLRRGLDSSFALLLDAIDERARRYASGLSDADQDGVPQWRESLRELRERHRALYAEISDGLATLESLGLTARPFDWRNENGDDRPL